MRCTKRYALLCLLATFITAGACSAMAGSSNERHWEDATRFFTKGKRIGISADAGLYKESRLGGWDHVGTVHSVSDDLGLCQTIAETLNAKGNEGRFACRLLND